MAELCMNKCSAGIRRRLLSDAECRAYFFSAFTISRAALAPEPPVSPFRDGFRSRIE